MIWCALVALMGPVDGFHAERDASLRTVTSHNLYQLDAGQEVLFVTDKHTLRLRVVDSLNDEYVGTLSEIGTTGQRKSVFVFGATSGRTHDSILVVRAGRAEIGKRLEVGLGSRQAADRFLTGPVRRFQILR